MIGDRPRIGYVLRYSYLWKEEHDSGRDEASKDRPCVLIVSVRDENGRTYARVLPITHSLPRDPRLAIEIPAVTKRRLGLDGERSWIILSEGNRFAWPGPDLRPVPRRKPPTIYYGPIPPELFEHVRARFLELIRASGHADVPR